MGPKHSAGPIPLVFLTAVSTAPRVVRSSEKLPGLLTLTSQSSFSGFRELVTRLRPTSNRVVREQHGMSDHEGPLRLVVGPA